MIITTIPLPFLVSAESCKCGSGTDQPNVPALPKTRPVPCYVRNPTAILISTDTSERPDEIHGWDEFRQNEISAIMRCLL